MTYSLPASFPASPVSVTRAADAQVTRLPSDSCDTDDMTITRDEVHRLIDAVPEGQISAVGELVRAAIEESRTPPDTATPPVRVFASAGTLSADHDLAERVEQVLRAEDGTAA